MRRRKRSVPKDKKTGVPKKYLSGLKGSKRTTRAKLIKRVHNLRKDIKEINIKGMNEFGSGGMNTKIEAAKICNLSGCNMIIANGLHLNLSLIHI